MWYLGPGRKTPEGACAVNTLTSYARERPNIKCTVDAQGALTDMFSMLTNDKCGKNEKVVFLFVHQIQIIIKRTLYS